LCLGLIHDMLLRFTGARTRRLTGDPLRRSL
jgi:hypothetical protein